MQLLNPRLPAFTHLKRLGEKLPDMKLCRFPTKIEDVSRVQSVF